MKIQDNFGLYLVITNPATSFEQCAEAAVATGVRFIQLRMKHTPRERIAETARALRKITAGTETFFIVNDDPALASEVGADGVHLGQDDMPLREARERFPELKIFGLSTHSLAQVATARAQSPDYIGVGPVFATPTKEIPDPALGLAGAKEMIAVAPCPAVAIGGLDTNNLRALAKTGAKNFAVVRAICLSENPLAAIRGLQKIWAENA